MTHEHFFPKEDSKKPTAWKAAFVDFMTATPWDWFITIGVGHCPDDDEVLRRLRLIEAKQCAKHVTHHYHKLPEPARYSMAVSFEGDRSLGNRHAHILVYVPACKTASCRPMVTALFPFEFRFLWHVLDKRKQPVFSDTGKLIDDGITFGTATIAREIYTVKDVQRNESEFSRFEFVTPPKHRKFKNENLSVIQNRNRQRRKSLGLT
jgi:hypothetical protein